MSLFFFTCCPLIQVAETKISVEERKTSKIYEPLFVFFSEFLHDMFLMAFLWSPSFEIVLTGGWPSRNFSSLFIYCT